VANASRPSGRQIGRAPADRASWYGRPPRSVRAAVDSLRRRVGDSDPAFVERAALNPCLLDAAQARRSSEAGAVPARGSRQVGSGSGARGLARHRLRLRQS
jgi:hypothetical protein